MRRGPAIARTLPFQLAVQHVLDEHICGGSVAVVLHRDFVGDGIANHSLGPVNRLNDSQLGGAGGRRNHRIVHSDFSHNLIAGVALFGILGIAGIIRNGLGIVAGLDVSLVGDSQHAGFGGNHSLGQRKHSLPARAQGTAPGACHQGRVLIGHVVIRALIASDGNLVGQGDAVALLHSRAIGWLHGCTVDGNALQCLGDAGQARLCLHCHARLGVVLWLVTIFSLPLSHHIVGQCSGSISIHRSGDNKNAFLSSGQALKDPNDRWSCGHGIASSALIGQASGQCI